MFVCRYYTYLCSSPCLDECICEYAGEFVYGTLNRSVVYESNLCIRCLISHVYMWKNHSATEQVFSF